jgi:hypothetical protein
MTTRSCPSLAITRPSMLPSAFGTASALRTTYLSWLYTQPAPSPADASPGALTDADARLRANADRYSFIVRDFHLVLLAGLPAHPKITAII